MTDKRMIEELQREVSRLNVLTNALRGGDDAFMKWRERAEKAEAELATVRGQVEDIREWVAYRQDYSVVCRELTKRLDAALAPPPAIREAFPRDGISPENPAGVFLDWAPPRVGLGTENFKTALDPSRCEHDVTCAICGTRWV